jgi:hypothetical protein
MPNGALTAAQPGCNSVCLTGGGTSWNKKSEGLGVIEDRALTAGSITIRVTRDRSAGAGRIEDL